MIKEAKEKLFSTLTENVMAEPTDVGKYARNKKSENEKAVCIKNAPKLNIITPKRS